MIQVSGHQFDTHLDVGHGPGKCGLVIPSSGNPDTLKISRVVDSWPSPNIPISSNLHRNVAVPRIFWIHVPSNLEFESVLSSYTPQNKASSSSVAPVFQFPVDITWWLNPLNSSPGSRLTVTYLIAIKHIPLRWCPLVINQLISILTH